MANSWLDVSEIVAGLILSGRISPHAVRPDLFVPPYDNMIKAIRKGENEPERLIEIIGLSPVQSAHEAVKNMNGLGDCNWVSILENSALNYDAGTKLEKFSRKLKQGEDVNWTDLAYLSKRALQEKAKDLVPLSSIESGQVPFVETGWNIFDKHTGGIPEIGLIVIGGIPGVGKTSFSCKMSSKFIQKHKEKTVVFFSLEMVLPEIAARFREIETMTKDEEERLLLCEVPVSPEELLNMAATVDDIGLIVIDFADYMIKGETSESSMSHIYRTLAVGSKELRVPIILLSQLNRSPGLPKPNHLRWTGLAEALAWMIIMLYDPARDWKSDDVEEEYGLQPVKNTAYAIIWKVRGGFRKHIDESPGAILMPFRGDKGWGDKRSKWFSLMKD